MTNLDCNTNHLTSVDVSANNALNILNCNSNLLTSLDVSANNVLFYLYCKWNPYLHCIQVLNVAAANANTNWHKDTIASYSNNCGATTTDNVTATTFNLFPNPTNNTLHISGLQNGDQYRLYNTLGQLLLSKKCVHNCNETIDIPTLSNGIYTIQFERNNTKYISKFVKESF